MFLGNRSHTAWGNSAGFPGFTGTYTRSLPAQNS